MKRKASFLGMIILFSLLVMSQPVAAQSESVSWSAKASYEFGEVIHFQLTVDIPEPIERATLFIQTPEFSQTFSVTKEFTPSHQIATSHDLDMAQVSFAPFATVTYWWLLETAVGDIALPEQTFDYVDDRFEWWQLERDGISVHWTGEEASLGQLALDITTESLIQLERLIPTDDNLPLQVYLYPSSADLRAGMKLTGRDWVGAHAHPELGVILVTAVNSRTAASDLRQSIPHELVHFLLYQATGPNYDNIPIWFNEGLATYVEKTPNPSYETLLAAAVAENTTIPFADLCHSFPAVEDRALLAYAQSASLVNYIQSRYGNRALSNLVVAYADGADCQSGVSRVLQESLGELNQDWLRQQQPHSPFVRFWLENGWWFLLLVGGFGLMSLLIIFPNKKS